jgi:hypothetical protein
MMFEWSGCAGYGRRRWCSAIISVLLAVCGGGSLPWREASADTLSGKWREKSQLIWLEATQQLVRRTIRVWDSEPQKNLEFYWEPDATNPAPQAEVVEGHGTLTWRRRGAPNYDRISIYSTYRGELRNGRPHGDGRLELHTGASYEGGWAAGLMEGQGSLQLESGDIYVGKFAQGKFHGHGRHEAPNGIVYEGAFANGERHGVGVITSPTQEQRTTTWVNGREVREGELHAVQVRPGASADIGISVVTDAQKNRQLKSTSSLTLTYTHQLGTGEVAIVPDDTRFVNSWKQGGPMFNLNEEAAPPDFSEYQYDAPAILRVAVSGSGTPGLFVKSLRLEVAESRSDLQPFLGVQGSLPDWMRFNSNPSGYDPVITFVNLGWGPVTNSKATISFAAQKATSTSQSSEQQVGSFDKLKRLSVERELRALGVDIAQLSAWNYTCPTPEQLKTCQQYMLSQLRLGGLKPHVSFFDGGRHLVTYVSGMLEYQWEDSGKASRSARSPFKTRLVLGEIQPRQPAEGGGPDLPNAGVPVLGLSIDRTNYQLSYPLNSPVALPDKGRDFIFGLSANKSSNHRFRVVAELSDGRTITSRPITLTYARPRNPPSFQELRPVRVAR